MPSPVSPLHVLRTVFGYDEFRPLQLEVIEQVLQRRDTLAIMPTGGGKSLCYQIPALIFSGLTVVVSPLIALMKDQVEQLTALGVPAMFLNSSLTFDDYQNNIARARRGEVKLLYVAPETLLTPRLFNLLSELPLDCLTIDEAHCISEWGHDFRPEYRRLVSVRERFPQAVCLALTATATPRVRQDIQTTLGFDAGSEFIASFNRPNLLIEVQPKTHPGEQTLEFLQRFPDQSGIIYCFSRKQVDDLAAFLNNQGFFTLPYHAGLEDNVRRENQERFIRDDVQIIVATIAFGMGINKPDVRFILHHDLPKSIEGYYQEIGRAGRDGLPAHCLLLYSFGDVTKQRHFIQQKGPAERKVANQHLAALIRYADATTCRRVPLLAYFGETFKMDNCGMCDNCRRAAESPVDITLPAQKFLSCVKRTGERFAAVHIAHVLLGVENEKVLKYGHQNLSTYGIGKELTLKQWLHLADQLVHQNFLEQSSDMYRVLRLTPSAYDALKNRKTISGYLPAEPAAQPKTKPGEIEFDRTLFERLRKKRKDLADEARIPPYVIFSDRTLQEMAAYYPLSEASLMTINGVGRVKLERYGHSFLNEIAEHCQAHGLSERPKPGRVQKTTQSMPQPKPRHIEIGEAYNLGESIETLAAAYAVQTETIMAHLTRYGLEGHPLRQADFPANGLQMPAEQQEMALQAFAELGAEYLKPVYEALGGSFSYDSLKILRLYYLCHRKSDEPAASHKNPSQPGETDSSVD